MRLRAHVAVVLAEHLEHAPEPQHRVEPEVCPARVDRAALDADVDSRRAHARRSRPSARRLGDDADVAGVAGLEQRQRAGLADTPRPSRSGGRASRPGGRACLLRWCATAIWTVRPAFMSQAPRPYDDSRRPPPRRRTGRPSSSDSSSIGHGVHVAVEHERRAVALARMRAPTDGRRAAPRRARPRRPSPPATARRARHLDLVDARVDAARPDEALQHLDEERLLERDVAAQDGEVTRIHDRAHRAALLGRRDRGPALERGGRDRRRGAGAAELLAAGGRRPPRPRAAPRRARRRRPQRRRRGDVAVADVLRDEPGRALERVAEATADRRLDADDVAGLERDVREARADRLPRLRARAPCGR